MNEYYDIDDRNMRGTLRDWRKALRTPATYRVGHTVRIQPQFVLFIILIGLFLIVLFYFNLWASMQSPGVPKLNDFRKPYNATYPLTPPLYTGDLVSFKIGIIADMDKKSKSPTKSNTYSSYLKRGWLTYNQAKKTVQVVWDPQSTSVLTSTFSEKGRGMELSELIVYDGRLLTFDDRSGVVFEIINNKMIPWVILTDGNGQVEKGFKSEWAAIKDEVLYVGSMGKEWTTLSGDFENYNPMWVKAITKHGEVQHFSWVDQYKALRGSIGINFPGYMIHESGVWSALKKLWHFLPRRCSQDKYNETEDETKGCDYLITADDTFKQIHAAKVTQHDPKQGFSSFKFIPGTDDQAIVALKTTEFEGSTATYITAFTTDGVELMPDTLVENVKYEGIEFI